MPLPADAHLGAVSLTVKDLDRSVSFYRDILGFRELSREGRTAFLSANGDRVLIELHERRDAVAKPRRSTGLFHFAILVPSRAALGRSLRRLSDRQWPLSGVADHLVSEALYLNDPDGLGIEIYRDRPRDTWRSANGELAMATDPLDVESVANEPGAEVTWHGLETGTVIGHVHLHVSRLDKGEAFYCGRIGFEPVVRGYPGALFVSAGGYHHHLGMNTWVGVGAAAPPENAVGLRSFTVEARDLESRLVDDASTRVVVAVVGG
ncbi:MAG: VOC family protein [Acidobacteria bacterium]|nr:VOC family protein [Acidobacteriota bacterium]MSO83207.1 VOC family protein [Acidobacteriota bacterium]